MRRIMNCLCHPSRIGLYYKDKMHIVIIHVLAFAAVFIGILSLNHFKNPYFEPSTADSVTELVIASNDTVDIVYKDNKLSGTELVLETDEYQAYFLKTNFIKNENKIIMSFGEESVDIFFGPIKINTYKYSDSSALNFEFADVKKGSMKDKLEFEALINGAFDSVNTRFTTMDFVQVIGVILGTYITIIVISMVFTFFTNPAIGFKIRFKLCLYSSLIYFIALLFTVGIGISWLQYVAYLLPIIYSNITFSHIVRVNVKRD